LLPSPQKPYHGTTPTLDPSGLDPAVLTHFFFPNPGMSGGPATVLRSKLMKDISVISLGLQDAAETYLLMKTGPTISDIGYGLIMYYEIL